MSCAWVERDVGWGMCQRRPLLKKDELCLYKVINQTLDRSIYSKWLYEVFVQLLPVIIARCIQECLILISKYIAPLSHILLGQPLHITTCIFYLIVILPPHIIHEQAQPCLWKLLIVRQEHRLPRITEVMPRGGKRWFCLNDPVLQYIIIMSVFHGSIKKINHLNGFYCVSCSLEAPGKIPQGSSLLSCG